MRRLVVRLLVVLLTGLAVGATPAAAQAPNDPFALFPWVLGSPVDPQPPAEVEAPLEPDGELVDAADDAVTSEPPRRAAAVAPG